MTKPTPQQLLITVDELAEILCIGRTIAWELVRRGTIKSVKIGRTRRVPIKEVQGYIDRLLDGEVA